MNYDKLAAPETKFNIVIRDKKPTFTFKLIKQQYVNRKLNRLFKII